MGSWPHAGFWAVGVPKPGVVFRVCSAAPEGILQREPQSRSQGRRSLREGERRALHPSCGPGVSVPVLMPFSWRKPAADFKQQEAAQCTYQKGQDRLQIKDVIRSP